MIKKLHVLFSFTSLNSADPVELQHYAAFHLGLQRLQTYSFKGFLDTKSQYTFVKLIL